MLLATVLLLGWQAPAPTGGPHSQRVALSRMVADTGVVTPIATTPPDKPTLSEAPRSSLPADRLAGTGNPTVWSEFGQLAAETGAVNLGQGFPDW